MSKNLEIILLTNQKIKSATDMFKSYIEHKHSIATKIQNQYQQTKNLTDETTKSLIIEIHSCKTNLRMYESELRFLKQIKKEATRKYQKELGY